MTSEPLVLVRDLRVQFESASGVAHAVRGVDLTVDRGQIMGLVGESGCGKSLTARALLRLLPPGATMAGTVQVAGVDVGSLAGTALAKFRGAKAAMVFQNPMDALNPVFTLREQLFGVLKAHGLARRRADLEERARTLVADVGLPEPSRTLSLYPHQLSGGMQQRAMVAFALASEPELLIADEPTTALDVTVQKQVLDLISSLREERGLTVLFITHDLAVMSQICDEVTVLYAGRTVETGTVHDVISAPKHPYTRALIGALPAAQEPRSTLMNIPGAVPSASRAINGCAFAPRCPIVIPRCLEATPPLVTVGSAHKAACIRANEEPAGSSVQEHSRPQEQP